MTTLVDRFREEIRKAQDLGETTFNGKPAHAYPVAADAKERVPGRPPTTWTRRPRTRSAARSIALSGDDDSDHHTSTATSSSRRRRRTSKLLDAPNIDAAQVKAD